MVRTHSKFEFQTHSNCRMRRVSILSHTLPCICWIQYPVCTEDGEFSSKKIIVVNFVETELSYYAKISLMEKIPKTYLSKLFPRKRQKGVASGPSRLPRTHSKLQILPPGVSTFFAWITLLCLARIIQHCIAVLWHVSHNCCEIIPQPKHGQCGCVKLLNCWTVKLLNC